MDNRTKQEPFAAFCRYPPWGALLFALAMSACAGCTRAEKHEVLRLDVPHQFTLEHVYAGEHRLFHYLIRNISGKDLGSVKITPSCGCVAISPISQETWKAGEDLRVSGSFDFGMSRGERGVAVIVQAKDSQGRVASDRTLLSAKVDTPVVLSQSLHDFGTLDCMSHPEEFTIDLVRCSSEWQWDNILAETNAMALCSAVERVSDSLFRLKVHLDPAAIPISAFHGTISLQFFLSNVRLPHVISIPIVARVRGPFVASPATVMLGTMLPNDRSLHAVSVMADGFDVQDLVVESEPSFVSTSISSVDSAKASVSIRINRPPVGILADRIILLHAKSRIRLSIPVMGEVIAPEEPDRLPNPT